MQMKRTLALAATWLVAGLAPTITPQLSAQPTTTEAAESADQEWHDLKKGLRYRDLKVGDGREARRGKMVTVHYVGRLADGTIFQSSRDNNRTFVFRLGEGQVIQGWDRGMLGMKVGGIRRLQIPAKLGYGKRGIKGRIPKDADLDFEVELLAVTN